MIKARNVLENLETMRKAANIFKCERPVFAESLGKPGCDRIPLEMINDSVFEDEWEITVVQRISPSEQTKYIKSIIDNDDRAVVNSKFLDEWLIGVSSYAIEHGIDRGAGKMGRAVRDAAFHMKLSKVYDTKTRLAKKLFEAEKNEKNTAPDSETFIEEFHKDALCDDMLHGIRLNAVFSSYSKIEILRVWGHQNDQKLAFKKLGSIGEKEISNSDIFSEKMLKLISFQS